jgi:hypothetical protein
LFFIWKLRYPTPPPREDSSLVKQPPIMVPCNGCLLISLSLDCEAADNTCLGALC